jgi:hypothetical protein
MKYIYWFYFLVLMGVVSSCIKNPIHLDLFPIKARPDRFECYVNGADFVPDSNRLHLFYGPILVSVSNGNNGTHSIYLSAHTNGYYLHDGQSVYLHINNVSGTGVYEFNDPVGQYSEYVKSPLINIATINQQIQPAHYYANTPGHGNLTLTRFDLKNNVIAGTFWFTATNNSNAADSVRITGGHFNLTYNP